MADAEPLAPPPPQESPAPQESPGSQMFGELAEPIELLESDEEADRRADTDPDEVVDGVAVSDLSESDARLPDNRMAPDPLLHWVYLGMALGVIFLSLVLRVEGEEHVVVPVLNRPIPGTCTFKRITGVGCPGCGLTRAFVCLGRGDLVKAWHFNPVGLGVALLVVAQVPYRILQLNRIKRGLPELRAGRLTNWVLLLLALGLFLQWIWRLGAGGL